MKCNTTQLSPEETANRSKTEGEAVLKDIHNSHRKMPKTMEMKSPQVRILIVGTTKTKTKLY